MYIHTNVTWRTGGLTGAGARITGAFGDVFAKLTFDDDFIDRRQQEKVKSNKLGSKFGGFFKVWEPVFCIQVWDSDLVIYRM